MQALSNGMKRPAAIFVPTAINSWRLRASRYRRLRGKIQNPLSGVNPSHLAALSREYPLLAERHLTGWRTCLRVMPADNRPYCGADAFLNNLWWFAGLGGRGMSLAPALADELARQLTSKSGEPIHRRLHLRVPKSI